MTLRRKASRSQGPRRAFTRAESSPSTPLPVSHWSPASRSPQIHRLWPLNRQSPVSVSREMHQERRERRLPTSLPGPRLGGRKGKSYAPIAQFELKNAFAKEILGVMVMRLNGQDPKSLETQACLKQCVLLKTKEAQKSVRYHIFYLLIIVTITWRIGPIYQVLGKQRLEGGMPFIKEPSTAAIMLLGICTKQIVRNAQRLLKKNTNGA